LSPGDVVETTLMESMVYDQGNDGCTTQDLGRCTDGFSYIPYGEWIGLGDYQKTSIKITPRIAQVYETNSQTELTE
jgi:hypothetical protein